MTQTLRESALRRRDRHHSDDWNNIACLYCGREWPCADYRDAQNDLDQLNQAPRAGVYGRLVPDPEEAP